MRTPARYTEIAPATLALENKPFLPVVPSERRTQLCWGSQVSALLMKFPQYQGDTAGLPQQAPALFLSVTKRSSSR